jgi:hypothetical protein
MLKTALVSIATAATLAAPTLTFKAPADWKVVAPSSSMRVAEFALARVAGDSEDASLVVYFFGGGGGSVQANMDRWIGQLSQPDGQPSSSVARTSNFDVHGLKVTMVDVSGTYVAETSPGASEHFNKPGFRQVAAVVETPGGPYYVKFLGPAKTVAKWKPSFDEFMKSVEFK